MPALVLCPVILTVSPTAKLSSVQTPRFRVTNWALGLSTMKLSASAWSARRSGHHTTSTALLWVFSEVKVISRPLRSRRVRDKPSAEMESIRKTPLLLMLCLGDRDRLPGQEAVGRPRPALRAASDGPAGELQDGRRLGSAAHRSQPDDLGGGAAVNGERIGHGQGGAVDRDDQVDALVRKTVTGVARAGDDGGQLANREEVGRPADAVAAGDGALLAAVGPEDQRDCARPDLLRRGVGGRHRDSGRRALCPDDGVAHRTWFFRPGPASTVSTLSVTASTT